MTPFMLRVQARLDGDAAPAAATVDSRPVPAPVGTDAQMMVRALAEQLVSEANAVLRGRGEVMTLDDEVGPGGLTFTLGYQHRAARVSTVLAGRYALASLVIDGHPDQSTRRLGGENDLQALVLSLIDTTLTDTTLIDTTLIDTTLTTTQAHPTTS